MQFSYFLNHLLISGVPARLFSSAALKQVPLAEPMSRRQSRSNKNLLYLIPARHDFLNFVHSLDMDNDLNNTLHYGPLYNNILSEY